MVNVPDLLELGLAVSQLMGVDPRTSNERTDYKYSCITLSSTFLPDLFVFLLLDTQSN